MKLSESLPNGVTVDGRFYPCDFDFRNVLRMLDTMQRDDLIPDARDYLCLKHVIRRRMPRKTVRKLYTAVSDILFEKRPETGGKRVTSYEQDAGLIRSAFRQVYHIDLFRERLHWLEFLELLQNLPEGNRYEEIIGIRTRPLPAPNKYNQKEREWLLKAKQAVALHLTDAEQARKYDEDAGKIFAGIFAMIPQEQKEVNSGNG